MSERGQLTQIIVGAARADVSLIKASAKPRAARHDVRRVPAAPAAGPGRAEAALAPGAPGSGGDVTRPDSPMGEAEPWPSINSATSSAVAVAETSAFAPETVQHGVRLEDGTWVDLTAELAAIDERTRLDGLAIVATTSANNVPRTKVRGCHYVAPAGEGAPRFLATLWRGLRDSKTAALVRWTKRTDQYLGALLPRGAEGGEPHLVLLELEWEANVREVPGRCRLGAALAEVPPDRGDVAARAMRAMRRPASVFAELRDERAGQRADLLGAAREGRRWEPPAPEPEPDDLGRELAGAGR
jgi:hypothetical protein